MCPRVTTRSKSTSNPQESLRYGSQPLRLSGPTRANGNTVAPDHPHHLLDISLSRGVSTGPIPVDPSVSHPLQNNFKSASVSSRKIPVTPGSPTSVPRRKPSCKFSEFHFCIPFDQKSDHHPGFDKNVNHFLNQPPGSCDRYSIKSTSMILTP